MTRQKRWMAYTLAVLMLFSATAAGIFAAPNLAADDAQQEQRKGSDTHAGTVFPAGEGVRTEASSKTSSNEEISPDDSGRRVLSGRSVDTIIINGVSFQNNLSRSGQGWNYYAPTKTLTLDNYNGSSIATSGDLVVYARNNVAIRGGNGEWGEVGLSADNLTLEIEDRSQIEISGGNASIFGGGYGVSAINIELRVGYSATLSINGGNSNAGDGYDPMQNGGHGIWAQNLLFVANAGSHITVKGGGSSAARGGNGIDSYYADIMCWGATLKIYGGYGYWGGHGIDCIYTGFHDTAYLSTIQVIGSNGWQDGGCGIVYNEYMYAGYGLNLIFQAGAGGHPIAIRGPAEDWGLSEHLDYEYTGVSVILSPKEYKMIIDGAGGTIDDWGFEGIDSLELPGKYPDRRYLGDFIFQKQGYKHISWSLDHQPVKENIPIDSYGVFDRNKVFTATYAPIVSGKTILAGNGGTVNGQPFMYADSTATLPSATPESYDYITGMLGWSDRPVFHGITSEWWLGLDELFYLAGDVGVEAGTEVLFAHWDSGYLPKVFYHGNDGKTSSGSRIVAQVQTSGSNLQIYHPANRMFQKPNYEQRGWNTAMDGTGVWYDGTETILGGRTLRIYAQWGPTLLRDTIGIANDILQKIDTQIFVSKDGSDRHTWQRWTKQEPLTSLQDATITAEATMGNSHSTQIQLEVALNLLSNNIDDFNSGLKWGSRVDASNIQLNLDSAIIHSGELLRLTATLLPANHTDTVTWVSSNPSVATVSEEGLITGHKEGQATITATTQAGLTAQCAIVVIPLPQIAVSAVKGEDSLVIDVAVTDIAMEEDQPLHLIYVVYSNSRMVGCKVQQGALVGGCIISSETVMFGTIFVPDSYKVFLLKKDGLRPLCIPAVGTVD